MVSHSTSPAIKSTKKFVILPYIISVQTTAPVPYIGQSGPNKKPLFTDFLSLTAKSRVSIIQPETL